MRKTSFLLVIGILVLIGTGSYVGYNYWQTEKTAQELSALKNTFQDYQSQIAKKDNQNVLQAIAAKEVVQSLKADTVKWSQVIKDVRNTIPKSGGKRIVEVLTYSGSSTSELNMNVKTNSGSNTPYLDVAELIQAFDEHENFDDSFVPSISLGVDDKGEEVLSLIFTNKYVVKEELGAALSEALEGLEPEEVETTVISR